MKRFFCLFAVLLTVLALSLPAFAIEPARGDMDEVFKDVEMHITFDDTTGRDDTKQHSVLPYGTSTHVSGVYGRGMCVQYNLNHLEVQKMSFGAASFSVSGWFRMTFHANLPMLYTNRDLSDIADSPYHDAIAAKPGWSLYIDWQNNTVFSANVEGGTPFYCTFPTSAYYPSTDTDAAKWHHMALVVDRESGTVSLYMNGKQVGETFDLPADHAGKTYDTAEKINRCKMAIGDDLSGDYQDKQHMIMFIDEISLFLRALTAEEVAAIYDYVPQVPETYEGGSPVTDEAGQWVIANPPAQETAPVETVIPETEPVTAEPETDAPDPAETDPSADESDKDAYGGGTAKSENTPGQKVVNFMILAYGVLSVALIVCVLVIPKKKR